MTPDVNRVRHLDLFNELNIPKTEAIFISSAIMAVYGLRENGDLDIAVTRPIFRCFTNHSDFKLKKSCFTGAPKLKHKTGAIEIRVNSGPEQVPTEDRLWNESVCISGYHFLSFDSVIASKLWCGNTFPGRQKDLDDVETIRKFLLSLEGGRIWHR